MEESDLVWDDTLDIYMLEKEAGNFLGPNRYQPVLESIYSGLGITKEMLESAQFRGRSLIGKTTCSQRVDEGSNPSDSTITPPAYED